MASGYCGTKIRERPKSALPVATINIACIFASLSLISYIFIMNHKILLLLAVTCFLTAACNNNTADKPRTDAFSEKPLSREDSLEKEVMAGHDTAMAKMGRVRKYLALIAHQHDSISKLPARQQNQDYQEELMELEQVLNYAAYSMDTWMGAYAIDSARGNQALRIQYLESEKKKVDTVKRLILESIQQADSVLKKP